MVLFRFPGMAQLVSKFAEPGDPEYAPPVQKGETPVSLSGPSQNLVVQLSSLGTLGEQIHACGYKSLGLYLNYTFINKMEFLLSIFFIMFFKHLGFPQQE